MSYDYHRTNTQGYRLCGLHSVAHYQSLWPCASSWDFTHWSSRCPPGCDTCHFHSFCVSACPGASRYQCQNKSLSRTQLQGFGNSNPTMCQEERELETPLKNTNNYQSFVDSGPGPWQNREGRTFPLGAPDSQCLFSSLFPCPYLCPFSVLGPFFSTIRTGDYLIFLLVCIILKSMLYLQDYFPFLALSLIMELKPSPNGWGEILSCGAELGIEEQRQVGDLPNSHAVDGSMRVCWLCLGDITSWDETFSKSLHYSSERNKNKYKATPTSQNDPLTSHLHLCQKTHK